MNTKNTEITKEELTKQDEIRKAERILQKQATNKKMEWREKLTKKRKKKSAEMALIVFQDDFADLERIIKNRRENQELLSEFYSDIIKDLEFSIPETENISDEGAVELLMDHIGDDPSDNEVFNKAVEGFKDAMSYQRIIIQDGFAEGRIEHHIAKRICMYDQDYTLAYPIMKEAVKMLKKRMEAKEAEGMLI